MVFSFSELIKFSGTETHPAAETQSLGLPAYAQLAWVFADHLAAFTGDPNSAPSTGMLHLQGLSRLAFTGPQTLSVKPGLSHLAALLDNETSAIYGLYMDQKLSALATGIVQKLMPARAAVGNY